MDARDTELKRELDATLQTRRELGPEYEDELVASFLTKVEERFDHVVDKRVRRGLAEQQMTVARGGPRGHEARGHFAPDGAGVRLGVALASLVIAIPLSAIAVVNAGLPGLLICWTGIVGVNALQASRSWGGSRRDKRQDDGWD